MSTKEESEAEEQLLGKHLQNTTDRGFCNKCDFLNQHISLSMSLKIINQEMDTYFLNNLKLSTCVMHC